MESVIVPFIALDDGGAMMLPEENRQADRKYFRTIGWNPLSLMPNNGLSNVGYCRCGKGIQVFYWPGLPELGLMDKTLLRCHDHGGPCCKSSVTINGKVVTYGGLLLALEEVNFELQSGLIATLKRGWLDRIANRELEWLAEMGQRAELVR